MNKLYCGIYFTKHTQGYKLIKIACCVNMKIQAKVQTPQNNRQLLKDDTISQNYADY